MQVITIKTSKKMSLNAKQGEKKQRPIPPVGAHAAICYGIIDLGTHMKSFQGQDPKPTPLVQFCWEFPLLPKQTFDEAKGPQPLAIFQEYTVSLGDKSKLGKMLESWRGVKAKDLAVELPAFLGQPCLVNVIHNPDKQVPTIMYANIAGNGTGIMRMPQGLPFGALSNQKIFFNLDNYSHAEYAKLPEWIQKKLQLSQEWSGIVARFGQPTQTGQATSQQPNQNFQQQPAFQQPVNTFGQQQPDINQGANINQPPPF